MTPDQVELYRIDKLMRNAMAKANRSDMFVGLYEFTRLSRQRDEIARGVPDCPRWDWRGGIK